MTDTIKTSRELLPCPFCGGEADPTGWMRGDGVQGPECESCGATAASAEDWNRRAQPPEQPGAGEREAFEAAYQRAVDSGWTSVKDLAGQIWEARAALSSASKEP